MEGRASPGEFINPGQSNVESWLESWGFMKGFNGCSFSLREKVRMRGKVAAII